jgi:hypothetical protein
MQPEHLAADVGARSLKRYQRIEHREHERHARGFYPKSHKNNLPYFSLYR